MCAKCPCGGIDECAVEGEAGRIEVTFELVGIESKIRQTRLGIYDTTGNSCAMHVARH